MGGAGRACDSRDSGRCHWHEEFLKGVRENTLRLLGIQDAPDADLELLLPPRHGIESHEKKILPRQCPLLL